jgi:hypothetical protein
MHLLRRLLVELQHKGGWNGWEHRLPGGSRRPAFGVELKFKTKKGEEFGG